MTVKIRTEIIENYRKENNLTISAFCKKCGISHKTYYRIMQGHTNIRLPPIIKILNTMNILCSDIIVVDD